MPIARHKGSLKFLAIKGIFIATVTNYVNTLTKRSYNKTDTTTQITTTQINHAFTILRNKLLNKINTECLPLKVTYNSTLPNLKTIIAKNWHVLQTEPKLKKIVAERPILASKFFFQCK